MLTQGGFITANNIVLFSSHLMHILAFIFTQTKGKPITTVNWQLWAGHNE